MAKKKALWKELGLKEVKSESGNRKGFITKEGNYISERQFRKDYALTPMKGSKGYKERQAAKAEGKDFRPVTVEKVFKEMKEAAKKPGMTLEEFMTGKSREVAYSERRSQAAHNKFIDKQRREAIEFKRQTGVMTDKQAATALKDLEKQIKAREKAQSLNEELNKPLSKEKRERLTKQLQKQAEIIRKQQTKLEKKGVVILDEKAAGESLRYGYYH